MKIYFRTAAALALATVLSVPARAIEDNAPVLERAVTAFQAGEYLNVLELAKTPPAEPVEAARLSYLIGETHLLLGSPSQAEASFRSVLEARPKAVPAQVGLANSLLAQGQLEEAGRLLESALRNEPRDTGAKTALGRLLARLERYDEAVEALADARKAEPGSPFVTRASVEVLLAADRATDAAGIAEAFIQENPDHPMGNFLFAIVLERDGEDELALGQYQEAIEKDGKFLDAHKNLAILCHTLSNTYQDKDRTRLAFAHYARYFELGGSDESLRAMYDNLMPFKDQILGS